MTSTPQPEHVEGTPDPDVAEPPAPAEPKVRVLDTSSGAKDGINRCGKCGSTHITYVRGTDNLQCDYCRHTWTGRRMHEELGLSEGIDQLSGRTVGSGAQAITDTSTMVTLKCSGCGAEVVINTATNLREACHWCRQQLSLSNQIPNGAVPDGILPFSVTREQAAAHIKEFAHKRRLFATADFKDSFEPTNVMGVYLPYMVVDGNVRARLDGIGEILKRRYTIDKTTYYDADQYQVVREFDMAIDDVIVESSSERADMNQHTNTNNIINAILPFDVTHMVHFDANYMGDFTSERRDLDIDAVEDRVGIKFLTIAREQARAFITHYKRGVRWESEQVVVRGTRWVSVYLPVWLYSHYETKSDGSVMCHYVAVNGRSGATMGSIPFHKGKALAASGAVGAVATVIAAVTAFIGIFT